MAGSGLYSCDICRPAEDKFRVIGFNSGVFRVEVETSPEIRPRLFPITNQDTLAAGEFGIEMRLVRELFFSSFKKTGTLSLVLPAYACSLLPPTTDDFILDIQVVSDKAFDEAHPAGSNLADLFSVVILDEAARQGYQQFELSEFARSRSFAVNNIVLVLEAVPANTDAYSFQVIYTQNGEKLTTYEYESPPFVIHGEA